MLSAAGRTVYISSNEVLQSSPLVVEVKRSQGNPEASLYLPLGRT